jgi:hypothetical protein
MQYCLPIRVGICNRVVDRYHIDADPDPPFDGSISSTVIFMCSFVQGVALKSCVQFMTWISEEEEEEPAPFSQP